jgi:hypothetical protein
MRKDRSQVVREIQNIKFLVPHGGRSDINQHTPSKKHKDMMKR